MESLDPKNLSIQQLAKLILGGVTPRPIALVSSLSKDGVRNLAPFSFFNVFGYNPPVLGFSPANRGRDGTHKDTYLNIQETKECVVQIVTRSMGEQISLASAEFDSSVDEFDKSGLTPINSECVAPPRVEESPFQMECKLMNIINLGGRPASGNLILCEVVRIHVIEDLNWERGINPLELDSIGRLGGSNYIQMHEKSLFNIEKPSGSSAIGFDNLPENILTSKILTGNNLAQLANESALPSKEDVQEIKKKYSYTNFSPYDYINAFALILSSNDFTDENFHSIAKLALEQNDTLFAWKVLLLKQYL